jgi:lysophospholipase L1-like esterase
MRWVVPIVLTLAAPALAEERPLAGVKRVVFLGDSITYSGAYIEDLEAVLRVRNPGLRAEFLNLGLPSETVSGLSEPGHAGGAFPRPVLNERLDRVLEATRPDLVVACYGMNDGIYYPYDEARARKYQDGLIHLRERCRAVGARVLHLTPPVFDAEPIRDRTLPAGLKEYRQPFEGYDAVLERYSDWLLARRREGWDVVDVHAALRGHLDNWRRTDPGYRLAGDGVHANEVGHWLIARAILQHWGVPRDSLGNESGVASVLGDDPHGPEILTLIQKRQRLTKDAWLTATGHKRPGMKAGLPLDEARKQAAAIEAETIKLLKR